MTVANKSLYVTPATSSGDPIAGYTSTVGGTSRDYQTVMLAELSGHVYGSLPTYYVWSSAVTPGANKHHLTFWASSNSTGIMKIRKLFSGVLSTAAITGAGIRFDFKRCTGLTTQGGTALTPERPDTLDATLSTADYQFWTGHTSSGMVEGNIQFAQGFTNEEIGITHAADVGGLLMAGLNWMPEGSWVKDLTLRGGQGTSSGQGMTVKQISASTVGSMAWLGVVTVESS